MLSSLLPPSVRHAGPCVKRRPACGMPARTSSTPTQLGDSAPPRAAAAGRWLAGYFTVTEAPAPSSTALALSAASLLTFSSTAFGAPSTRSLASFRPRLVSARTSLMT